MKRYALLFLFTLAIFVPFIVFGKTTANKCSAKTAVKFDKTGKPYPFEFCYKKGATVVSLVPPSQFTINVGPNFSTASDSLIYSKGDKTVDELWDTLSSSEPHAIKKKKIKNKFGVTGFTFEGKFSEQVVQGVILVNSRSRDNEIVLVSFSPESYNQKAAKILSDTFKFTGRGKSTKSIVQEPSDSPSAQTPVPQHDNANNYNVPYCENNPNPVFTADITDFSKILYFIPPVTIQTSGQKGHGYVKIADKVPVYAPVDSVLYDGAYYSEENRGQFTLAFEVSCEVRYMFDHLSEVSEKIRKMFPENPQADTRSSGLPERISIKAGELIGYSIGTDMAKTWDFGVYNLTEENPFNDQTKPDADSFKNKNAVCPFSYFEAEKKSLYMGILRNIDGSPLSNPTSLCRQ